MNFGVLEVAHTKSHAAPGWAYVPDINPDSSHRVPQPRKRARTQHTASTHETSAKQDAKILREIEELQRENCRDVSIGVPVKRGDAGSRDMVTVTKSTQAVRKILSSQKTFTNHLEDYHALKVVAPQASSIQPVVNTPTPRTPAAPATYLTSTGKRSHKKKDPSALINQSAPVRKPSTTTVPNVPLPRQSPTIPPLSTQTPLAPQHLGDNDPLLFSRIPKLPSQEEIERLVGAPPLSYSEAKGGWVEEDRRRPRRVFCEVCGYWGRVRCKGCGGRVCALECLAVHGEECWGRYGG
ncbi:hypothetical protein BJ875DRAFT_378985 [Amylocarpus encephaloides]|uniref:HIT-type domain-containing protein n=1 Tax=Amylocarpus encephaloides TaxID=45428 RepID=A0A9P8C4J1_9HELO|nr:hypothetical protein BJ875DRAFT_378985 [Amylocarpus encephaloides]